MKRRLQVVSPLIFLLLLFGLRKAHDIRAEQKSTEFRESFLRHAPVGDFGPLASVHAKKVYGDTQIGICQGAELDDLLSDVHLAPCHETDNWSWDFHSSVKILIAPQGVGRGPAAGIYLSRLMDEGWIILPPSEGEEWKSWMLSSSSCQSLKRRLWSRYSSHFQPLPVEQP